jgi:protein tyrosine phosphatase (PTP) superfamily phosphohydrolase (DUF442 family)
MSEAKPFPEAGSEAPPATGPLPSEGPHAGQRALEAAAQRIIRFGKASPRLRAAGLWIYGTATMVLPRGREVPKLGEVGPGVWRGAQPGRRGFAALAEMGIKTVVNLRPESDHERAWVERLGLRYLYMPLPPLDAPSDEQTHAFLEAVTKPEHQPVFFHCYHGVDRTGTMAACLRIARDGWSLEQALEEMRAYKVHEHGQGAKLAYVGQFAGAWAALPAHLRRRILNLPDPEQPTEPSPKAGRLFTWLLLAAKKLSQWVARLRGPQEASPEFDAARGTRPLEGHPEG